MFRALQTDTTYSHKESYNTNNNNDRSLVWNSEFVSTSMRIHENNQITHRTYNHVDAERVFECTVNIKHFIQIFRTALDFHSAL